MKNRAAYPTEAKEGLSMFCRPDELYYIGELKVEDGKVLCAPDKSRVSAPALDRSDETNIHQARIAKTIEECHEGMMVYVPGRYYEIVDEYIALTEGTFAFKKLQYGPYRFHTYTPERYQRDQLIKINDRLYRITNKRREFIYMELFQCELI